MRENNDHLFNHGLVGQKRRETQNIVQHRRRKEKETFTLSSENNEMIIHTTTLCSQV